MIVKTFLTDLIVSFSVLLTASVEVFFAYSLHTMVTYYGSKSDTGLLIPSGNKKKIMTSLLSRKLCLGLLVILLLKVTVVSCFLVKAFISKRKPERIPGKSKNENVEKAENVYS